MRRRVPIPLKLNQMVRSVSNELLVNAYAEMTDSTKGTVALRSHPGLMGWGTILNFRGVIELNEVLFVVAGTSLYTVDVNGVGTPLMDVDGTGFVVIAGDEDQVIITNAGGDSFCWNTVTATGGPITSGNYQAASSVASLNKTTLWSVRDSAEFIWSAIDDATTISSLDVASAEFKSDNLLRLFIHGTDLLLFGTRSLEGWFDSGSADTPYERRGDLLLNVGLAGTFAVTEQSDVLAWLAHEGTIRSLDQGAAVRISTASVERLINGDPSRGTAGWSDLSRTRAFSYIWRGHLFMTFRHPDGCVQYDLTTKLWSVRRSYGSATWDIVDSAFAFGQYYLFDQAGNSYSLDEATRWDDGHLSECIMVTPAITADGMLFNLDGVSFMFDTGRGPPGTDPKAVIWGSDDGYTFPDFDEVSLGQTGDYAAEVNLLQQGQAREKTYRIQITDDLPVTLTAIYADMRLCRG